MFALCVFGRFYTLLVISTALFDEPPYKNLIVNGLVLARCVWWFNRKNTACRLIGRILEVVNFVGGREGQRLVFLSLCHIGGMTLSVQSPWITCLTFACLLCMVTTLLGVLVLPSVHVRCKPS